MQTVLLTVVFVCLVIDVGFVYFAATRLDRDRTTCLTILCCCLCIYSLGYIIELMANTPHEAYLALVVEIFGISLIAPFSFLTFLSLFTPSKYKNYYSFIALIYGIIFFWIVLTNPMHHLYYTSIEIATTGTFTYVRLGRGILAFVNQGVTFIMLFIALLILLSRYSGSRKLRRQMVFFVIGALGSFIANGLNVFDVLPAAIDPTPVALTFGLVFFSSSFIMDDLTNVVIRARNIALDTMEDALIVLDNNLEYLYSNNSATTLFPELTDFHGSEPIETLASWPEELKGINEEKEIVFTINKKDEEVQFYRAIYRVVYRWKKKPIGLSIIIHDTTEKIRMYEQLEELATLDPLTGILNRRKLFDMMQREIEIAKRNKYATAVIMFDIDHFKQVNDVYGNAVGDNALKESVKAVKESLRSYDIFGRLTGKEFIVFTRYPGDDNLIRFANRLRKTIESIELVSEKGEKIRLTASFGTCVIPEIGNLQEAINKAESTMHQARDSGGNRVMIANLNQEKKPIEKEGKDKEDENKDKE